MKQHLMGVVLAFLFFFPFLGRAESPKCTGETGVQEGMCAPNFMLKSYSGESKSLYDYRGKVVFLNFWATWCAPCIEEIPSMERLLSKLDKDRFVMIAVSIDSDGKAVIDGFFQNHFGGKIPPFEILLDSDQKVSKSFGTFKVPETFILDPSGKIRDKVVGAEVWDKGFIRHYLELLAKE